MVDSTGGSVAAAGVKLVDTQTGQMVVTRANGEGFFAIPNLKPSRYSLSVTAPGFQTVTRPGIAVRVQDRLSVDFRLEVGESSTVITVDAPLPYLESETSSLGSVVGEREIQALPLNGRNYIQLATLGGGTSASQRTQERNTFVANGARPIQNSYLLDGIDNKNKIMGFDAATAQSVEPVIDAIAEFKVQTSNYSAEFGQSAGAVVNATIKSGTNNLHGSLFEFVRNSYFDAQPYFQPPGGAAPALIQNQFGATLGGAVVKNRTFFFFAWQSSREVNAAPQLATVPTAQDIGGQFRRAIYDPASTRPNPDGGFIRDPFPGSAVPVARFDAVAAKLLPLYPAPNRLGGVNYLSNQKESLSADQYIGRIDHEIGSRDTVFARYIYSAGSGILPGTLPPPANDISVNDTGVHSAAASETHSFSSHLINEARVGVQQSVESQQSNGPRLFSQYGINGAPEIETVRGLPVFSINGFSSLGTVGPGNLPTPSTGSGNLPLDKLGRTIQLAENLTFVHGRQTMKFGFDYQQVTLYADATVYARPVFSFTAAQTQNPLNRQPQLSGAAFADFLLGQTTGALVSTRSIAQIRQNIFQGYWQDDWKVLPRLTVNVGVRYELPMPFYETSDRYANLILEPGPLFGKLLDAKNVAGTGYRRSFSDPNWRN
ncbi:MAG: carboxypeptidase-like regulatory domain-containing protein, partial [Bryobacteraceae bacterium]